MNPELGRRIQFFRKKKGLTQDELADLLGVSRATVARWESGIRLPKGEWLFKLANVLEIPPSKLFEATDTENLENIAELLISEVFMEKPLSIKDKQLIEELKPLTVKKLEALKEEIRQLALLHLRPRLTNLAGNDDYNFDL